MSKHIAIIDYGMGNLRSVQKALEHVAPLNSQVFLTSDPQAIANADAILFPGQGAARACMQHLEEIEGLEDALFNASKQKPFLGICMGMQVLMERSAENDGTDCLGWFEGQVKHFGETPNWNHEHKIPQMGWNQIHQSIEHPLWQGIAQDSRFYFVHSYYVQPQNPAITAGTTQYGLTYTSALAYEKVFAIQAHPEKSADAGLQLLRNFCHWNGE